MEWIGRPEWLPIWAFGVARLVLSVCLALVFHYLAVRVIARAVKKRNGFWRPFLVRTRSATRLVMVLIAVGLAQPSETLPEGAVVLIRHAAAICIVGLIGWIAMIGVDLGAALYMRGFRNSADSLSARKHLTQVRILRRAANTLVIVLTVGLALMTISGVRQWGVSLLAAGGAASVIVGLALQPLLSNLLAGLQIAVTQPIRIGDSVIVEKEAGDIEEITSTYVVVRLWDWRRMVLPLSYFMQKPFENWTRETASLIGVVLIYVDHRAPVETLRKKLEEIVRAAPRWDGQVLSVQVTDFRETAVEVRCIMSARNAGETFDLRCEVRERILAFLASDLPEALPRRRSEVEIWEPSHPGAGRDSYPEPRRPS